MSSAPYVSFGLITVPAPSLSSTRLPMTKLIPAQSKVASSSILGNELFNNEMPWFWSDQYDLKLQMAGLSSGYDECHIIGDTDSAEFIACYGKEGYLIALDSVNQSRQFMLFKKALGNGFKLEMSLIKDKNFQPESIFSGSN